MNWQIDFFIQNYRISTRYAQNYPISNLFNCHKEVINAPPVPSISRCIHIVYRHKNVWEYQWSNFIYNCMSTFHHYVRCKDDPLICSTPGGEKCESLTGVDEIACCLFNVMGGEPCLIQNWKPPEEKENTSRKHPNHPTLTICKISFTQWTYHPDSHIRDWYQASLIISIHCTSSEDSQELGSFHDAKFLPSLSLFLEPPVPSGTPKLAPRKLSGFNDCNVPWYLVSRFKLI